MRTCSVLQIVSRPLLACSQLVVVLITARSELCIKDGVVFEIVGCHLRANKLSARTKALNAWPWGFPHRPRQKAATSTRDSKVFDRPNSLLNDSKGSATTSEVLQGGALGFGWPGTNARNFRPPSNIGCENFEEIHTSDFATLADK